MAIPTDPTRRSAAVLIALLLAAACTSTPPAPTSAPTSVPSAAQTPTSEPTGEPTAQPTAPGETPTSTSTPGSGTPPPGGSPLPTAPPGTATEPSPQAGLLLSEVRFAPAPDDAAFIEIANTSDAAIDLQGASLSLDGAQLSLRSFADPLPPGAVALVLLDELFSTEGFTLHASVGVAIAPDAGVIELLDRTGLRLDRVAWGDADDAVSLTNGGMIPDTVEPGISIGRAPGMTAPHQAGEWVVFEPAEATPGAANGLAAPAVLLPLIGAILDTDNHQLDWYPVVGATSYRVQLQAEGSPVAEAPVDVTTTSLEIDIGARPPGAYGWSVTAITADGTESLASAPSQFQILAPSSAISLAAQPGIAAFPNEPGTQLTVPMIGQRKDTAMLMMDLNRETGPHAWDVAHPRLDPADLADNKNCALAAIAMVNHFFGGDLNQDRIGYEYFEGRKPGPETDLNRGYGLPSNEVTPLMIWALGAVPTHLDPGYSPEEVWTAVKVSIDAGLPVVAAGVRHTMVFTGYTITGGKRIISYNDPWTSSVVKLDIDALNGALALVLDLWLPAAGSVGLMQEPGVTEDSDGDGVVDFDEVERFFTDPRDPDTDADKVADKEDILSGVFDPMWGYATAGVTVGRDFDYDERVTELDPDSDGGECKDGEEDTDYDGHRGGSETWNFDLDDDKCERHGAFGRIVYTSDTVYDPGGETEQTSSETLTLNVRLKPDPISGGMEDDGSSFQYRTTVTGIITGMFCTITSHAAYGGGGLITGADGVIRGGMNATEDEFSVAASVPIVVDGTIDYCAFVESASVQDAASTPGSSDCVAKVADKDAEPRVFTYGCRESGPGFTWSLTGTITVVDVTE